MGKQWSYGSHTMVIQLLIKIIRYSLFTSSALWAPSPQGEGSQTPCLRFWRGIFYLSFFTFHFHLTRMLSIEFQKDKSCYF